VTRLVECLRDPDSGVREKAAKALSKLSRRNVEHAEALQELLQDAGHRVRSEAAGALGKMYGGNVAMPQAANFAELLATRLEDSSFEVRLQVVEALGKFGRRAAAHSAELEAVKSNDRDLIVREAAEKALHSLQIA